jgi:hypothetical protein
MQIKADLIKSSQCCSCPKSGNFQKHILDSKNQTKTFFNKIKILPEKNCVSRWSAFVEKEKRHFKESWPPMHLS